MQQLQDTTNAVQPERSSGSGKRVTRSMSKRGSSSSAEEENPGALFLPFFFQTANN
jgi:hypothetical protein